MAYKVLACLILLAVSSAKDQTRWSRQISSYTADISDWVPLTAPIENHEPPAQLKRQAVAEPRILSEPFPALTRPLGFNEDTFPSRSFYNTPPNRQLYLQSVPSAPQNYLSDQGFNQGLRLGLSQPNFPLTQGFVSPQYNFDSIPQFKIKPQVNSNPIKFDNLPLGNPPFPAPAKPFLNQPKPKQELPKFVDGYRLENNSEFDVNKRKPQSLQKIRFDNYDKSKEVFGPSRTKIEREEVQLLYVPLESLNKGQFNFRNSAATPQILHSEQFNQNLKQSPLVQNLAAEIQRPAIKPVETYQSQDLSNNYNYQLRDYDTTKYSTLTSPFTTTTATTPKPKKLKPHQPPLAIFLSQESKRDSDIKVGDVLSSLKNARTVPVLDSVNPVNAPEVFIGPSSLTPPDKFVKFELPYLSNIENKDKKLKQLPFFVAPLSYDTPQGFAKIPFPSPHVGSVVINSQIQDSSSSIKQSTVADVYPNSYSEPYMYNERQPVTQKPKINYYSTVPTNEPLNNYNQNYYSIESQSVSTARPPKQEDLTPLNPNTGSYFISNVENQYNPSQYVNFPQELNYQNPESIKTYNTLKQETTSTSTTVNTRPPTTYSNRLLETHNPYSINQGLQFNNPNENQNYYDENKDTTQGLNPSQSKFQTLTTVPTSGEISYKETPSPKNPSSSYEQNYRNEAYFKQENQVSHYPVHKSNEYPLLHSVAGQNENAQPIASVNVNYDNRFETIDTKTLVENNPINSTQETVYENYSDTSNEASGILSTKPDEYNEYNYSSEENQRLTTPSSTTTTTTTKRTPIRTRGRPKYPTKVENKTESIEFSTRSAITRRPLRERRPSTNRARYEPNKIVTEKTTKPSFDTSESTTKGYKHRTRGKVHFKPSEGEEIYEKQPKQKGKENDLAYQRDILHQNYPVTIMERASTADIEAITEPTGKDTLQENVETVKSEDTENAYSNDKLSIAEHVQDQGIGQYMSSVDSNAESYIPKSDNEEYDYHYTSAIPQGISTGELKEDSNSLQTTPKSDKDHIDVTAALSEDDETNQNQESERNEYFNENQDRETSSQEIKYSKDSSHEISQEVQGGNIVETTPSYNKVRIRPGVIRQYHQASTTESTKTKNDRRNNIAITYRPAFDKRRTTMRIEEIEADLKTKQIHTRPEFKDYRQPIYKPEPTTESTSTTAEITTKRGHFRRRRPTYTTTSTETSINRRPYEVKNRFRGRRPTDKPEEQIDVSNTTVKNIPSNKYIHRPKLSERFNKKPIAEETTEDQDPNYSINRPKYASPDSDRWSPKISGDSFKPYNPNDITSEIREKEELNTEKPKDDDLDIITAGNEDILISVTPASNNRLNKKIPDIPPTLEALVEQTKVTQSDQSDTMSTFESMLEEVMKSLEEQDEDEYTNKVIKHKGGEIGEIPPERIISSGVNYSLKLTTPVQEEITTMQTDYASSNEEESSRKSRRRGYWKKVKVRPAAEEIDVAESQYYSKTVNGLGQNIHSNSLEKFQDDRSKFMVTTYKPRYPFLDNILENKDVLDVIPNIDIPKIHNIKEDDQKNITNTLRLTTESYLLRETSTDKVNPGEMDLGTGSPDPTYDDTSYYTEPTEPTSISTKHDRSDKFSFMDYLFGVSSPDESVETNLSLEDTQNISKTNSIYNINKNIETESQINKTTTESTYIPEEITAETHLQIEEATEPISTVKENKFGPVEVQVVNEETSSVSSFIDPKNIISTSMSTEISHETEICFRGKCIKTFKNLL